MSSSSDITEDFNNPDEEDDDLLDLYSMLASEPSIKAAASSIITLSKQYTVSRPSSGVDNDMIKEMAYSGTNAQKLYLRKCAELHVSPSKIFLSGLNSDIVDIGHQNIGSKGVEACAIALSRASSVRVVNMNDNAAEHSGAKYIAHMLKDNHTVSQLNLADNSIGFRGAKYLVNVIMEFDKISHLDLSNNALKENDAYIFKQMLEETRNLKYLNLSHNMFREVGGQLLGEALSYNDSVEELDLSWNHLRREGAAGLAQGLMDNVSLKRLNVSWNGFYLEGCIELGMTLAYNNTLEVLDLTNNRINRECIDHLTRGLARNITLHTLILKFNPMTSMGANDILQFLADCHTSGIKLLDLGIQQIEQSTAVLINEVHLQGRELNISHGHIIGSLKSNSVELEKVLIEEHPSLVLIEFGKLMGFRLMDLFSSLDKNGSRTLDRDEIKKGLKMANVPFSDACIDVLIKKLDVTDTGEIDFSDLLVAQQEHRKQLLKMIEAEESNGRIRVEDTLLWKIRTKLQKLMAEKMRDYSTFKRVADEIAKQVQHACDEVEGEREEVTKFRARMPRQIRSSTLETLKFLNPVPVDDNSTLDAVELQNDAQENKEESKNDDITTAMIGENVARRRKTIHIPVGGTELHNSYLFQDRREFFVDGENGKNGD